MNVRAVLGVLAALVALFMFIGIGDVVALFRGSDTVVVDTTSIPAPTEPDEITEADTVGAEPAEPAFRLLGTEPFWNLRIDSTGLRFISPDDTVGVLFGATRAILAGDSLRWNSLDDRGRMLEAVVAPEKCSDGMSDRVWPYRARVTIGKDEYKGCAERRP